VAVGLGVSGGGFRGFDEIALRNRNAAPVVLGVLNAPIKLSAVNTKRAIRV